MGQQQHSENFESSIGSGKNSFAPIDGGALMIGATISDLRDMRLNGPTNLPEVGFIGLGIGLPNDRQNGDDKLININFDGISSKPEGSFDRLPFFGPKGESLHDQIEDKIKQGMEPKDREQVEKEEQAYKKAFDRWGMMVGIGIKPPSLDDYPHLKELNRKVTEAERGITKTVMDGLTADEQKKLEREDNPLGPVFAPKPMHDEVAKRVREETKRYLYGDNNSNKQVSQREHNRT